MQNIRCLIGIKRIPAFFLHVTVNSFTPDRGGGGADRIFIAGAGTIHETRIIRGSGVICGTAVVCGSAIICSAEIVCGTAIVHSAEIICCAGIFCSARIIIDARTLRRSKFASSIGQPWRSVKSASGVWM